MSQNLGTWQCLLGHLLPVTQGGFFTTWGKYGKEWGPERTLVSNGEAAAQQLPKGRAWEAQGCCPTLLLKCRGLPPPPDSEQELWLPSDCASGTTGAGVQAVGWSRVAVLHGPGTWRPPAPILQM